MNTIQIIREELLKPLQHCLNIAERKSILPILSYVYLDFCDHRLSIVATDTEIQLTLSSVLQYKNPACIITLPGYKLLEICKGLSEGTLLSIEVELEKVVIVAGKNRFTLLSRPALDYPLFSDMPITAECTISHENLRYLLSKTVFAIATQDIRRYLNGVLFNIEEDCLELVTTDSHRLALAKRPLLSHPDKNLQALVPKGAINELLRLITHFEGDWLICFHEQQISFFCPGVCLVSKLINEAFVAFKKLIPRPSDLLLRVSCLELKQALSLAAILSHEKLRGVHWELAHNQLKISAYNPEYEAAHTELQVDFPFDAFSVSFNVSYLLDIIAVIEQTHLSFALSEEKGAALIRPEGTEDCLFVVMPLLI